MASKAKAPLTDSDLDGLNRLIRECEETLQRCARCNACSIDVDPEKAKTEEQLEVARKIKATYFPNSK